MVAFMCQDVRRQVVAFIPDECFLARMFDFDPADLNKISVSSGSVSNYCVVSAVSEGILADPDDAFASRSSAASDDVSTSLVGDPLEPLVGLMIAGALLMGYCCVTLLVHSSRVMGRGVGIRM
jgi:hypothetical protein